MNVLTRIGRCVAAYTLLALLAMPVMAVQMNIQAEFRPDPANPHLNKFENKTPSVGYCLGFPAQCAALNLFSLRASISANSTGPIAAFHTDPRQGAMFKVPTQWQDLTVIHRQTQEVETVRVRIMGVGSTYGVPNLVSLVGGGVTPLQAHGLLWTGSSWVYPPRSCLGTGISAYGSISYTFFWRTPLDSLCAKQARFDIPSMRYNYLEFAYELSTPNPLGMSSGEYTGSHQYTVGPGQDFDLGNLMMPSSPTLTLNFTLSVQHELKVEVPPGANRIELVPQGGWQAWLNQGRKPARLFRDQTFNVSASSRFKMQMSCERIIGDTCALKNTTDGHEVPLDVSVSLPHGLTRADGAGVSRQPLLLSGAGTELFQPGFYINRRPGTLHFEVKKDYADQMLSRGGTTYSGQVTVVWDSEL
ncbi:hypothetical protein AO268_22035 [Pseudomonas sp. ICMP 8385]|uniref:Fimbrial protein n=3 Tax=Pseudomonas TaxID=286 RepID=A0ABS9F609_9PSED|nr:hypothetical protein [Pseudomonas gessardii]PHN66394.1 hypothetical protein AO268_22035 [Pseudomonas sp. ICMP 8385]MCF4978882.1 hypothetical protein [Pseudomonas gessardii]MCF5086088.1 hypothetical protein [Pseudomonas gessardii]MCF5094326.1 hypothetical protein [Pseudomonas gessardii]